MLNPRFGGYQRPYTPGGIIGNVFQGVPPQPTVAPLPSSSIPMAGSVLSGTPVLYNPYPGQHWVSGVIGQGHWESDNPAVAQGDLFTDLSDFLSKASSTLNSLNTIWRPQPPPTPPIWQKWFNVY